MNFRFNKITKTLLAATSLVILQSCNYRMDKPVSLSLSHPANPAGNTTQNTGDNSNNNGQSDTRLTADDKVSFNLIKRYSMSTCLKCHASGKQDPDLSTIANIQQHQTTVLDEVNTDSMPPQDDGFTALNICQKALLKKWIDLGTPDSSSVSAGEIPECQTVLGQTPVVVGPTPPTTPPDTPVVNPPTPPTNPNPIPSLSSQEAISYDLIKRYSLSTCTTCHSAGQKSPNLSTLADLQKNQSKVLHETDTDSMPPKKKGYAALTTCQKALLKKWADLGAPETSNSTVADVAECKTVAEQPPVAVTPILLMPLNYETLKTRILQQKCLSCHAEGADQSDLPFFPYSAISTQSEWSSPAEKSKVYEEIINKEDGMPPPESALPSLTDDEIEFVKKWIDAGRPE